MKNEQYFYKLIKKNLKQCYVAQKFVDKFFKYVV